MTLIDIRKVIDIAHAAGKKTLDIYENEDFEKTVDFKADDSPLTIADKAAHEIIAKELDTHFSDIPVLSEEGAEIGYEERKSWDTFWCVDPLDGTKEFINRNGQFTINIALIKDRKPILGVIYCPVLKTTYFGSIMEGSYIQKDGEEPVKLEVNKKESQRTAVRSRSHAAAEEEEVLKKYDVTDTISVGSSLKFCMVAEGKADLYYRHGPTMEWDTAAGQAVVEAAGGVVLEGTGPEPFLYNKENLRNGSFLCLGF